MQAKHAPCECPRCTSSLTATQLRIAEGIAQGLRNREIALMLGRNEKTVKNHISEIYKQLGVNCRPKAILRLIELGLVQVGR